MKEYYNVLYAVYTNFLLRIALTILMRYMFLEKLMEFTRVHHKKCSSYQLNVPHRKTIVGQKALSYVDPSLWNNLNKTLKTSASLNAFKQNIKQHYFNELKKKEF